MHHEDSKWLLSSESEEFSDSSDLSDKSSDIEKLNRKYEATLDFNLLQKLSAVHMNRTSTRSLTCDWHSNRGSGAGKEKGPNSYSQPNTVTHIITMGDSYKRLALRYHTKPSMIKKRNKISKPLKYMIGRKLVVPIGKDYTPRVQQQAAVQEHFFPALMKAFMHDSKISEVNRTPSYGKRKKLEVKKARQQLCIAGAPRNRPLQLKLAAFRRQKQFRDHSQIELGPIRQTAR